MTYDFAMELANDLLLGSPDLFTGKSIITRKRTHSKRDEDLTEIGTITHVPVYLE